MGACPFIGGSTGLELSGARDPAKSAFRVAETERGGE
jgi:hypothetical protein